MIVDEHVAHPVVGSMKRYVGPNAYAETVSGWLALLHQAQHPEAAIANEELLSIALQKLLETADTFWPEIADALADVELIAEKLTFASSTRRTAAALCALVYFHLEEIPEALKFALASGVLVGNPSKTPFVETMTAKCVEVYVAEQQAAFEAHKSAAGSASPKRAAYKSALVDQSPDLDMSQVECVVQSLINHSVATGDDMSAVSISLEARRLDLVEQIIAQSENRFRLLQYCCRVASEEILSKTFRHRLLVLLLSFYHQITDRVQLRAAYPDMVYCAHNLGDIDCVVKIFSALLELETATTIQFRQSPLAPSFVKAPDSDEKLPTRATDEDVTMGTDEKDSPVDIDDAVVAYQLAFDLVALEDRAFLNGILRHPKLQIPKLPTPTAMPTATAAPTTTAPTTTAPTTTAPTTTATTTTAPTATAPTTTAPTATASAEADVKTEQAATGITTDDIETTGTDTTSAINTSSEDPPATADTGDKNVVSQDGISALVGTTGDTSSTKCTDEESAPLLGGEQQDSDAKAQDVTANPEPKFVGQLKALRKILSGETSIHLALRFLHSNNRTDLTLLEKLKGTVDQRSAIVHNALVTAHGLMQAGTTCDSFLRCNLEWMARANHWSKFSASASLGVIHKGHISESRVVLSTYLPSSGTSSDTTGGPYSEGGAFYALGLIHANQRNEDIKKYMLDYLRSNTGSDVRQHGACLGIGLVEMSSHDPVVMEELRNVLFSDSAVAGEAAAYAIGLVMWGSNDPDVIADLLSYAKDTQHEKISRACLLAVAMAVYAQENAADDLIEELMNDKDALMRTGAMHVLGMAYCGTADDRAVRKLLSSSAIDVNDAVRRAAVLALAFILCRRPQQMSQILSMLCDSFNPHIRYASALASGIACAGTANEDVLSKLMPMTQDACDFVRQGALIAIGLVAMQASDVRLPRSVQNLREVLFKISTDKHEDVISRYGATVAQGLLNAGGRNVCASIVAASGTVRPEAAAGFLLFTQLWYWFPLAHCVSLAFAPTALIGLNSKLQMVSEFSVLSSPPSPTMFDYPSPTALEQKTGQKETITAVLSTTKKFLTQEKRRLNLSSVKEASHQKRGKATPRVSDDATDSAAGLRGDTASVTSEARSFRGTEISSTAATLGDGDVASTASTDPKSRVEKNDAGTTDFSEEDTDTTEVKLETSSASAAAHAASDGCKRGAAPVVSRVLHNPCRVLPAQTEYISYIQDCRYVPVYPSRHSGFIMLHDTMPMSDVMSGEEDSPKHRSEDVSVVGVASHPTPPASFSFSR